MERFKQLSVIFEKEWALSRRIINVGERMEATVSTATPPMCDISEDLRTLFTRLGKGGSVARRRVGGS